MTEDDVKNQNKPDALCIVGFIGGSLSDNTVIIPMFRTPYKSHNAKRVWFVLVFDVIMQLVMTLVNKAMALRNNCQR